ncbi:MAG: DUF998 domain-containing protein [Desulfurococcales archaeon]|nr:DUF998 domain-containing protein [Desulfurococcales archaeon]
MTGRGQRVAGYLIHTGPLAVVAAWVVIGLSWYLNRDWFVFARDAYSDFGTSTSCCPGLYNYGLISVGFLLALYGVSLWVLGKNKFEVGGSAYMVLAGVFLALIGVYPGGTRPHVFVSSWFFVQADMALILVTLGAWIRLGSRLSYAGFWASLAAFPVAFLLDRIFPWPSAAVLETYGIFVIDVVAILVYIDYRRVAGA